MGLALNQNLRQNQKKLDLYHESRRPHFSIKDQ